MTPEETPKKNPPKKKSSIHTTPLLQFYTQNRQSARSSSREPADGIRRRLSLTPVTRRHSAATSNSSVSRNVTNTTSGQASREPLSKTELDNLLRNCLELANKNRITEGNVWDLRLIDHLKDFQQPDDGEANVNFDRASAGLGAAVQIYTKRVESALTQAFEVMSRMNDTSKKNKKGHESSDPDNEDNLSSQMQVSTTAQRKKKKRHVTLAPLETITKKPGDTEQRDYLFEQSCAEFDEGGFNGMMMSKGGLCRGLEWVMDLDDTRDGPLTLAPTQGEIDGRNLPTIGRTLDDDFATELFDETRGLLGNLGSHCPEESFKTVLNDAVEQLQKKGTSQIFIEKAVAMREDLDHGDVRMSPMGSDDSLGIGAFEDADLSGIDPCENLDLMPVDPVDDKDDQDGANMLDIDNQGSRRPSSDDADGRTGNDNLPGDFPMPDIDESMFHEDLEEVGPTGEELKQILEQLNSVPVGVRAPQMAHWKFNRPSATASKPQQRRRRKKAEDFDFRSLPSVDLDVALASAHDESQINRKAQNKTVCKTLPRVTHYKPDYLVKLNLHFGLGGAAPAVVQAHDHASGNFGSFFDDDDGHDGVRMDDGGADESDAQEMFAGLDALDADGLVLEPPKVQEIDINLPKYAKQVDMDGLKGAMWVAMEQIHRKTKSELISFQDVVHALPEEGHWGRRRDLSVHICFAALLHIVNEHELEIYNTTDLCQINLRMPQDN